MTSINIRRHARLGTALAALALGLGSVAVAAPAAAAPVRASVGDAQPVAGHRRRWSGCRRRCPTCSSPTTRSPTSRCARRRQLNVFGKGSGETTVYRHRKAGRGGLCGQRSGRHQHRLGRRDAARWRCPKSSIQVDADEQPRGAHRHRRLARRRVARPQRLVQAYVGGRDHARCVSRIALGDAAAGHPEGQDRRSQPQPGEPDRRQSADAATAPAGSSSASARAASRCNRRTTRAQVDGHPQRVGTTLARRGQAVRARRPRRARPAPKATAWSRRSPSPT